MASKRRVSDERFPSQRLVSPRRFPVRGFSEDAGHPGCRGTGLVLLFKKITTLVPFFFFFLEWKFYIASSLYVLHINFEFFGFIIYPKKSSHDLFH